MKPVNEVHVAIVSFGYAPLRHVASTRAAQMAKGLAALGHPVTVLTVDWRGDRDEDDALSVVRANPRCWFPDFVPDGRPLRVERPRARSRLRTLARTLRWGPYARWAQASLADARSVHRNHPISIVWAIHGDDSAHEIAFRFARETGVPWVADFKDPWDLFHRGPRAAQRGQRRRRLATAAALTETARAQATIDRALFRRPTEVIWSGYDASGMEVAAPERRDRFELVHVGHLGPQHDCRLVAQLVEHLAPEGIELVVYGHGSPLLANELRARGVAARQAPFTTSPFEVMKGAGTLLVVPATHGPAAQRGGSVGVKELECFAAGTPTLCLGGLLPEMHAVAAKLPHVATITDPHAAAKWIIAQRALGNRGRTNHPNVAAHAWPSKALALSDLLRRIA
ncbi:MAG: hypothetical protein IPG50_29830 [Myxococcales bacterium]|nr:hypothetical protein [Myxococcales bacterium]